jgi:hypothetical protein
MRWMLNKELNSGMWKTVKIFTLIPRKCYDIDTGKCFIVWLEYINRNYKYNEQKEKYFIHSYNTINK